MTAAETMRYRVSMDIGGTFTDVVVYDQVDRVYRSGKVATTPADLSVGVLEGIRRTVGSFTEIAFTVHGTTVGLNAFLQRRGERVLLLATEGASDIYQIARGTRTRLYDLHFRKAEPLVPRTDIVAIPGRLNYLGDEIEPLGAASVAEAAERARAEGIRSIAVAFLFSYVNPEHELEAERVIRGVHPEANVSLSHRVAREWREYERTSSAVFDAYVAPVVDRYLGNLEDAMRRDGLTVPLHVMQSNGGVLTASSARRRPIKTMFSGPAGGTMGGVALTETGARRNLLCIDMGGTSFDVSLVVDGEPDVAQETSLGGLPLLMPIVNIHTIGAGGGSIAYLEAGGLRVGPESAGADPGPACYVRGGTAPTVTDANLVVGRIDPKSFLGGRMELDVAAAEQAIGSLAADLGLPPVQLAEGILDVVNAKMAQAIRTITVEQGIEPRDFTIVAFGGAGPMHAAFLARELEIREVLVPRYPGAFSAWGMLQTKLRHDFSRSYYVRLEEADPAALAGELESLAEEARAALEADGVPAAAVEILFLAEMRYVGQEYTVNLPLALAELRASDPHSLIARGFDDAHELRYGHANRGAPVEFVILRAAGIGALGETGSSPVHAAAGEPEPYRRQDVVFEGVAHDTPFLRRDGLGDGSVVHGPAVIEEDTATTIVPPYASARVDPLGSLVITLEGS
jgi:N-methylhydantoinase A